MTPGDIAMLLNETSGLRVQVTAPSLGAANIRVQGLRGRYTRLLADGLPLYTGRQRLEDNPYRSESVPYWIFGMLIERRFGPARLFVNAENLANVRQTRYDPLVRPQQHFDGSWTVDAWTLLEGRVVNGGLRFIF